MAAAADLVSQPLVLVADRQPAGAAARRPSHRRLPERRHRARTGLGLRGPAAVLRQRHQFPRAVGAGALGLLQGRRSTISSCAASAAAVNPAGRGTKAAVAARRDARARRDGDACGCGCGRAATTTPSPDFDAIVAKRLDETDAFYDALQSGVADPDARLVQRQAYAGMLWSKQFYGYDVRRWLAGDPLAAAAAAGARARPQQRLAAFRQRRRRRRPVRRHPVDARHLGISVVRRLGSGVPLRDAGGDRSRPSPSRSSRC